MAATIAAYRRDRDLDAITRIWREVGWISDEDREAEALGYFFDAGSANVALVDGSAECAVHWVPGNIRHGATELPLCAVTAVTTSLIARRQGLALRLSAEALAEGSEAGAAVAALGMFEQGFYDRTGGYEHRLSFDPASLRALPSTRPPVRLTRDDWAEVHAALLRRSRWNGSVSRSSSGWATAKEAS